MKKHLLALLAALLLSSPAWAAPLPGGDSNLPVDVTADNMEYSSDNKPVVFHGSVEAVRGEFKMWSDKLTLVLKGNLQLKRSVCAGLRSGKGEYDFQKLL